MLVIPTKKIFIKTFGKIVVWIFASLLLLQLAIYLVLQIPATQTLLIKHVTNTLSKGIDGQINIGRIYFVFFSKAIVKDFSIVSQGDTLLGCKKVSVSIPSKELLKFNLNFNKIAVTGGEFHLITESADKRTNLDRIFKRDKSRTREKGKGMPQIRARSITVEDFRFRLTNPYKYKDKGDSIINFAALDIADINVRANNISILNDTLRATIARIEGRDKSGFQIRELNGELTVCPTEARIENLTLRDGYSTIKAHYFSMQYQTSKDLAEFTDKVRLGLDLAEGSAFSFKTVGRITPSLSQSSLFLNLTGEVSGPVCSLRSSNLHVESESRQTSMNLDFSITGLPNIRESMCRVGINGCQTLSGDIAKIISAINGRPESELIKDFSPHIKYKFDGHLTGLPDDFVAYGILRSNIGEISTDLLLKNDPARGFLIEGKIKSSDFNIGKVAGRDILGELTMAGALSALIKRNSGGISLTIDSLEVDKIEFNGYPYSNISAAGIYNSKEGFDGRIICHDTNLDFLFQGMFSHKEDGSGQYDFYANIPYANLHALNLDKRDSVSIAGLSILSNIETTIHKDIIGRLSIMDARYENSYGEYEIGDIELVSYNAEKNYNAILNAPFMDMEYKATAPFSEFMKKGAELLLYDNLPMAFKSLADKRGESGDYRLDMNIYNSGAICQVIKPGLYIQDSTKCTIEIGRDDMIDFKLRSGRIAVGGNYLKDMEVTATNLDSMLNAGISCKSMKMAGMVMDSSALKVAGSNNRIVSTLTFKGDREGNDKGVLAAELNFTEDTLHAGISDTSYFDFKNNRWQVKPAEIICSGGYFKIEELGIYSSRQQLNINGVRDSLHASLDNFDISIVNFFINKPFDFKGYFSGDATISNSNGTRNLFLDMNADSVSIYGHPVGTMRLLSKWYAPGKRLNLLLSTKRNDTTQLMATGYYKPQNRSIEINATLDKLPAGYFEPFFSSVISKAGGSLSGDLKLEGKPEKLNLTGDGVRLNDFSFMVNFTKVPYTLDGPVRITQDSIILDRVMLRDRLNGRGMVTGGLSHENFKKIRLDTRINFANMQCLSLNENDNEAFYGKAFTTGSVGIKGDLSKITLDINIAPNENSDLHIPLSSASTASTTNLLTFKRPAVSQVTDPYDTLHLATGRKGGKTALQINLTSNMNSNADMFIEINKELGDIIRANGNGLITLNINPTADMFNIYGDYIINEGSYKFVLPGFSFASRDFVIQPGGNITFNGAVEETSLNLTAIYTTKAAINTLIADTSSVSARRNVNCLISMSGRLLNPRLDFDIEIPDLDPTTKVRVESALNSDGKIQKQFAALLISGGFLPDELSGITNNSTILYSNVSEMISNQINNIFTQLGIPLDLGLNYQPSDKGSDIFDVAVSTQLFNNRLVINGNIGNDPYSNSNSREVVGNVDVEIKLDRQGKLRLSLFSHAADKYSNYLDDSQRSGMGISYQQEFNTFREIFRKKSEEEKLYIKRIKEYRRQQRKRERAEKRAEKKAAAREATAEPLQSAL